MQHTRRVRLVAAGTAAIAILAAVPGTAGAVGATVTGDDGNPVPFNGEPSIRNMSPKVALQLAGNEKAYSATFTGPDGLGTSAPIDCYTIPVNRSQDYRGNGAYTITVQAFSDTRCKTPVGGQQIYRYSINASVALTGPATRVLIRQPNSYVTQPVTLPFAGNPGALGNEIRYAANAVVGPDGAITGPSAEGFVDTATNTVPLRLTTPGRYTVVARAKGFSTASGQFFSPWTAPVVVDAVAPFDVQRSSTLDARGPRYQVRIQFAEPSIRGRVNIAIARGSKRGRYRSYGTAKISSKATITKRFTLRRTGTYRLRLRYKGSATVAGGSVVTKFRVSRRFAF
jgi:hypothetical protein